MTHLSLRATSKWPIALVLWSVGAGIALWAIYKWKLGNRSKTWPTAKGKIIHSGVLFNADMEGWQPKVIYEYTVDGVFHHEGATVSFAVANLVLTQSVAREIVDRYPEGKTVSVSFNPANPNQAVLEPGAGKVYLLILLAVAAVFVFLGALQFSSFCN